MKVKVIIKKKNFPVLFPKQTNGTYKFYFRKLQIMYMDQKIGHDHNDTLTRTLGRLNQTEGSIAGGLCPVKK